jgi:hypothetical protein
VTVDRERIGCGAHDRPGSAERDRLGGLRNETTASPSISSGMRPDCVVTSEIASMISSSGVRSERFS